MMELRNVSQVRVVSDPPKPQKEGELIVWNIINPPNHAEYFAVESPEEAYQVIEYLADLQVNDDRIVANAFGLMRAEPKVEEITDPLCTRGVRIISTEELEWIEWYDDEGNDVNEHFELVLEEAVEKAASMTIEGEVFDEEAREC
jgi:hypothetical protein